MYNNLYYEYEQLLIGKKKELPSYLFTDKQDENESMALSLLKFVVKNYLKWGPWQVVDNLTWDIIDLMKLSEVMKYIDVPIEIHEKDYFYIVAGKMYPNVVVTNFKETTLMVYKRVLSGDLYKFPKDYLSGNHIGKLRTVICLQYLLEQFGSFTSIKEMYQFFTTSEATKMLKNYRLNSACVGIFDYPIDFLYEALPRTEESDFWYRFYRFHLTEKKEKNRIKREKLKKRKAEEALKVEE